MSAQGTPDVTGRMPRQAPAARHSRHTDGEVPADRHDAPQGTYSETFPATLSVFPEGETGTIAGHSAPIHAVQAAIGGTAGTAHVAAVVARVEATAML